MMWMMFRHASGKEAAMERSVGRLLIACVGAALLALPAAAQEKPADSPPAPLPTPPASEPAQPAPEQPAQQEQPALPGLDELLGTGKRGDTQDPSQTELERRLQGQDLGDAFREAVQLMGQAATRLRADDPERAGLATQRVQEDAVRKLDQLISQLEEMAKQRSRSRSSSSTAQNEPRPSQPRPQRTQQRQQANQSENNAEAEPPPRQDGPLRPELDSARASWGALPARVRDMLLQGSSDRFSSMYENMTEAYYRRLAEEKRDR